MAGTRAQSCDRYSSGTLHPGQVLGLVCHFFPPYIYIYIKIQIKSLCKSLRCNEGVEIWLHSFLNSVLDGGKWPTSTPCSFNPFLTFWREKISCFIQQSKGKHYKFIPVLSIHLYQIHCISTFGRLNRIENIVLRNIFYKISKIFRSSQVLS